VNIDSATYFIYEFETRDLEGPFSPQEIADYITEWNECMGTKYLTPEDFNTNEEYYEILTTLPNSHEAAWLESVCSK